jgi:hypothetical protein
MDRPHPESRQVDRVALPPLRGGAEGALLPGESHQTTVGAIRRDHLAGEHRKGDEAAVGAVGIELPHHLPTRRASFAWRLVVAEGPHEVPIGHEQLLAAVAVEVGHCGVLRRRRLHQAELPHVAAVEALPALGGLAEHHHRPLRGQQQQVDAAVAIGVEVEDRLRRSPEFAKRDRLEGPVGGDEIKR